jgi:hypothetical protein
VLVESTIRRPHADKGDLWCRENPQLVEGPNLLIVPSCDLIHVVHDVQCACFHRTILLRNITYINNTLGSGVKLVMHSQSALVTFVFSAI